MKRPLPWLSRRALLTLAPAAGLTLMGCTTAQRPPEPTVPTPTPTLTPLPVPTITPIAKGLGGVRRSFVDLVVVAEEQVVVHNPWDKKVYAYDSHNGKQLWLRTEDEMKSLLPQGSDTPSLDVVGFGQTRPYIMIPAFTAIPNSQRVYLCVDSASAKARWHFPPAATTPLSHTRITGGNDDVIIFSFQQEQGFSTIALDAGTGAQLWKVDDVAPSTVTANRVIGIRNSRIAATIDISTGAVTELADLPLVLDVRLITGDQIGYRNAKGTLTVFDAGTGETLIAETPLGAIFGSSADGTTMIASTQGTMVAGELEMRPWTNKITPQRVHQGYLVAFDRYERTSFITDRDGTPLGKPLTGSLGDPMNVQKFRWAGSSLAFSSDDGVELYSWSV